MSQYMPVTATSSDPAASAAGNAAQPGCPETRVEKAAILPRSGTVPRRWPSPSQSRPSVSTVALIVAIAISPVAAPPAGGAASATDNRSWIIVPPYHVTSSDVTLFVVAWADGRYATDDRRIGARDGDD